jgi:mono/diheme cytochrome c family protein
VNRISFFILGLSLLLVGCIRDDMADQPRYKPGSASRYFPDGKAGREIPVGTVPQEFDAPATQPYFVSWASAIPNTAPFPFEITASDLARGQEQFTVFCTPCHGGLGDGNGMIVQRGFPRPPSYHIDRLRAAAPGYFYNVITNGIGAMYSYNDRVTPDDRWRIAAYIQTLQYARNPGVGGPPATAPATRHGGGR